jgi:hypothetical protein
MDVKIYIMHSEDIGMSLAVKLLSDCLDEFCIAKLEAEIVEFACPDIDVADLPIHCCGPWNITVEQALTPLDLSRLKQAFAPPEPVQMFKQLPRPEVDTQPYQGYMNARHTRRRKW